MSEFRTLLVLGMLLTAIFGVAAWASHDSDGPRAPASETMSKVARR